MEETYLSILGYPYSPYDGSYRWHGDAPSQAVLAAVERLPTEETTFLGRDMDSDADMLALAAVIPAASFASLKNYQCEQIRALRAAAYQTEADGLFFGHEGDGDSRDTWLSKRAEIKARYPWPGTYR